MGVIVSEKRSNNYRNVSISHLGMGKIGKVCVSVQTCEIVILSVLYIYTYSFGL